MVINFSHGKYLKKERVFISKMINLSKTVIKTIQIQLLKYCFRNVLTCKSDSINNPVLYINNSYSLDIFEEK